MKKRVSKSVKKRVSGRKSPKPVEEKQPAQVLVSNCQFVGVQFDKDVAVAMQTVADGLLEATKALHALAVVIKPAQACPSLHIGDTSSLTAPGAFDSKGQIIGLRTD